MHYYILWPPFFTSSARPGATYSMGNTSDTNTNTNANTTYYY